MKLAAEDEDRLCGGADGHNLVGKERSSAEWRNAGRAGNYYANGVIESVGLRSGAAAAASPATLPPSSSHQQAGLFFRP